MLRHSHTFTGEWVCRPWLSLQAQGSQQLSAAVVLRHKLFFQLWTWQQSVLNNKASFWCKVLNISPDRRSYRVACCCMCSLLLQLQTWGHVMPQKSEPAGSYKLENCKNKSGDSEWERREVSTPLWPAFLLCFVLAGRLRRPEQLRAPHNCTKLSAIKPPCVRQQL